MNGMSGEPLVSVIVPAYNVEARIKFTLNSIINQDYKNLEIIFVDDNSSDNTLKIAKNILESSGKNFKIIKHESNLGVAVARNDGIDASQGELIWFCDGDDEAELNLISSLLKLILKYNCEIAFAGMIKRFENNIKPDEFYKINLGEPYVRDADEILYLRLAFKLSPHFCAMLYDAKFLKDFNLRFIDGCTAGQDVIFELEAMSRANKIAFMNECLYIYIQSSSSGQVRDRDKFEKRLRRYKDFTAGHFHAAEYISRHAKNLKIKSLAENLLLPEALIRQFNVYSREKNYDAFKNLLSSQGTKKILLSSIRFLFNKPEIFFKALSVILFPKLYYKLRQDY